MRQAALTIFVAKLLQLPHDLLPCFITHFSVVELPGDSKQALVVWAIEGSISIPSSDQLAPVMMTIHQGFASKGPAPIAALSGASFEIMDGMPVHSGNRGIPVAELLNTLLCSTGGTRASGRAPRGGAAKQLKGKGKGKQGMEAEDPLAGLMDF